MLADEGPEVLVHVPVVGGEVAPVDEGRLALGALPAAFGEVARHVAVQVLLRLERGAARQALEVLGGGRVCK